MTLVIRGGHPLRGAVRLPADAAIGVRALLFTALGGGPSVLRGVRDRGELANAIAVLRALGVEVEVAGADTIVHGVGPDGLALPRGTLDCGRSWTTLTLLAGMLAPQPFGVRLAVHASLATRDAGPVVGVLRARGAPVAGHGEPATAPLSIAPLLPGEPLHALECELEAPDPDVKAAALASGLWCRGPTALSEPLLSPDHTERMLLALGAPVQRAGSVVELARGLEAPLPPVDWRIPGSAELSAYLAAAATLVDGSRIALCDVAFNPSAAGFFDALRLLGGRLLAVSRGDAAGNEAVAELQVSQVALRGGAMGSEVAVRGAHVAPALCLLGVGARRGLELGDCEGFAPAGDARWAALADLLAGFGIEARPRGAGLSVAPGLRPRAGRVDADGDPRLGLCAVVLALAAEGESVITGTDGMLELFPELPALLAELGADVGQEGA